VSLDKAFYVNPLNINGSTFQLDKAESNHATRVLRLKKGYEICLLDGAGIGYHAKIKSIEKNVSGTIKESIPDLGENKYSVNLASALIKRDRFELMLEKATELGVTEIQPMIMERCVKRTLNIERCQKIVISSAKQCRRSRFPLLKEPLDLDTFLTHRNGKIICGHMNSEKTLSQLNLVSDDHITVLIGPEGDFTENEMEKMKDVGVLFFNLGERRLRAETAALNTLSVLNELLN
jgi:16S rRNA (uracil1498-N3)-methyltransferase